MLTMTLAVTEALPLAEVTAAPDLTMQQTEVRRSGEVRWTSTSVSMHQHRRQKLKAAAAALPLRPLSLPAMALPRVEHPPRQTPPQTRHGLHVYNIKPFQQDRAFPLSSGWLAWRW